MKGRLSYLDFLPVLKDCVDLVDPLPDAATEVDAWIERVKGPVAENVAAKLKELLTRREQHEVNP